MFLNSHPTQGDFLTSGQLRNYMEGTKTSGDPMDPCNWQWGEVRGGIPCATIDNSLIYSGDPVTNTGWIDNHLADKRTIVSSGKFDLSAGNIATFHTGIIIGRGTDQFNSITVTQVAYDTILMCSMVRMFHLELKNSQVLFHLIFPFPRTTPILLTLKLLSVSLCPLQDTQRVLSICWGVL